jgi:ATP-dependent protease HslVU (ClpYQ) peptidase subunit
MTFGLVKHNNNSLSAITSGGQLAQGKMTLLQTQTASSSASISFTSNIDSTYPIYLFKFIGIHPETSDADLGILASTDTGSSYGVATTSTFFDSKHRENDTLATVEYITAFDSAQSTSLVKITGSIANDDDSMGSGEMYLFNPSSTTFVKHFLTRSNRMFNATSIDSFVGGYINTTSAVDAIQFKMDSGNIDSGTIKLYGIKGS